MSYCVAIMIDAGMVFASDSRTNAGVDNIASFRKMKTFEQPGKRALFIVNSGNLAITQATINHLEQDVRRDTEPNVMSVHSMHDVAELVGTALRQVRHRDGPYLQESNVDSTACFIVGGQIAGEHQRLFLIYPEGNFIEATTETPYFQIGEVKYGKPIIDRVVRAGTSMDDAIKCVLVSFDSTMKSNLSVGLPIDLACYDRDALQIGHTRRFDEEDPYILQLRRGWSEGVRQAFLQLPSFKW